jgi:hypothetical protein
MKQRPLHVFLVNGLFCCNSVRLYVDSFAVELKATSNNKRKMLSVNRYMTNNAVFKSKLNILPLKGLSHEIFGPVFWAVQMYLGLNVNH